MIIRASKKLLTLMSLALIIAPGAGSVAGSPATVPVGTVIPLKMETQLSSRTSQAGDPFTATVIRDVEIDMSVGSSENRDEGRLLLIPADSRVEGHVKEVQRAERMSRAGTIAVAFDRLILPGGRSIPIDGTLTSLDDSARESFEGFEEDDRVEGEGRTRRAIIFIGAGAGVGAAIGAMTEGGKGAAVGAGIGAVLGTVGILLSRGEEAEIDPGTEFGMRVERAFTVDTDEVGAAGERPRTVLNHPNYDDPNSADREDDGAGFDSSQPISSISSEEIRAAQAALAGRGYYRGPINGELSRATSRALRRFQRDNNLAVTGDLNQETARKLDVLNRP
ncbi:MAG TPA: peptidoglycan-binding protein [Blastocatellia bacterium]|nr:peptidoglycan-binding protein [Blastocatellia bacterium]